MYKIPLQHLGTSHFILAKRHFLQLVLFFEHDFSVVMLIYRIFLYCKEACNFHVIQNEISVFFFV